MEASPTLWHKRRQLFEFVRELHLLRAKLITSLEGQPWSFDLSTCRADVLASAGGSRSGPQESFRLLLRRLTLEPCPTPAPVIQQQLKGDWRDPMVVNIVRQSELEHLSEAEALEQRALFERWVARREEWRVRCMPMVPLVKLFQGLFQAQTRLVREAEAWELVLADAHLRAPRKDGKGTIDHPLIIQPLTLDWDPDRAELLVEEGDRSPSLLTSLVRATANTEDVGLNALQAQITELGASLADPATARRLTDLLIHTLWPHTGTKRVDQWIEQDTPQIKTGPILILRRRTLGLAEAIDQALDAEVDQVAPEIPVGLARLLGHYTAGGGGDGGSNLQAEVLFTKPANPQQQQIVRRLEAEGAVLVQGPPGTGKTHTIANLIGHLLASGRTVLVTSLSTKALRVVRQQVDPRLRPLCVSVLEADTESRSELEDSLRGIVDHFTRTDTDTLTHEAKNLAEKRRVAQQGLEQLFGQTLIECKSRGEPIVWEGKPVQLEDLAEWLHQNQADGWIPGPIDDPVPLQLDAPSLSRLYELNRLIAVAEVQTKPLALPDPASLPTVDALLADRRRSDLLATDLEALVSLLQSQGLAQDAARTLRFGHEASSAGKALAALPGWLQQVVEDIWTRPGDLDDWQRLAETAEACCSEAEAFARQQRELTPLSTSNLPLEVQLQAAHEVVAHLEAGGGLGWWDTWRKATWKELIQHGRVAKRSPATLADWLVLKRHLSLEVGWSRLNETWTLQVGPLAGPELSADSRGRTLDAAVHASALRGALRLATVTWPQLLQEAQAWNLVGLTPRDLVNARPESARRMSTLNLWMAGSKLLLRDQLTTAVDQLHGALLSQFRGALNGTEPPALVNELLDLLEGRDGAGWRNALATVAAAAQRQQLLRERNRLLESLRRSAPTWAAELDARVGQPDCVPNGDLERALRWARGQRLFNLRTQTDPAQRQAQISAQQALIHRHTVDLVAARAWLAQRRRVDDATQAALVGWSDTLRRIGKGTGVQVPQLRARARTLLGRSRHAVPVWIMPFARVVESTPLDRPSYDVVIIDEASQLDVQGALLLAIGRQVVVVGDHEQVSPSGIGERSDALESIQRQHLTGIQNSHLFDGRTSLYDLARQSFRGMIQLVEHFRCAEEIIRFSNELCYGGAIIPLRDTSRSTVAPPVVPLRVPGLREEHAKINRIEALWAAAVVTVLCEHPAYEGKTLGVLSLLGEEQALHIDQILADRLTPSERARRRLVCGTPPQFQGDERDVVVLSVVDSATGGGPLRLSDSPGLRQRLNVAASRARDQLWVLYSLDPTVDLKSGDLRRRLLEFANHPGSLGKSLAAQEALAESEFERRVLQRLHRLGYRAVPQWPVGSYRLDIVVEGPDGRRLAIECDGERYHGTDRVQADLERQRNLERLGWTLHRIRGGSFFRDPVEEERRLVAALAYHGVLPWPPDAPSARPGLELQEEVMRLVQQRVEAWILGPPEVTGEEPYRSPPMEHAAPEADTAHPRNPPPAAQLPADRLLAILTTDWLSKHEILQLAPDLTSFWNQETLLKPLIQAGRVEAKGERRGRRYRAAEAPMKEGDQQSRTQVEQGEPSTADQERRGKGKASLGPPIQLPAHSRTSSITSDPVKAAILSVNPSLLKSPCPECGQAMILFVGRKGPFLKCGTCRTEGPGASKLVDQTTLEMAVRARPEWTCKVCNRSLTVNMKRERSELACPEGHTESWPDLRSRLNEIPF